MDYFVDKTLIIIKPDCIPYAHQIEWAIIDAGFTILNVNMIFSFISFFKSFYLYLFSIIVYIQKLEIC